MLGAQNRYPEARASGRASQEAAAPQGLRAGVARGFRRPLPAPAFFGQRGKLAAGQLSPGGAASPRGARPRTRGARAPRAASGSPHPCSLSAAPRVPRQPLGGPAAARPTRRTTTVLSPPPSSGQRKSCLRTPIGRIRSQGGVVAAAGALHWAPLPPVSGARLLPGLCWDGFKVEKVEEGRVPRAREGN